MYQKQEFIIKKNCECAEKFYNEHIRSYIEMISFISSSDYKNERVLKNGEPVLKFQVTEDENEDNKIILINEFWNGNFMVNYSHKITHGINENPSEVEKLLKKTGCGNYLQNKFIESNNDLNNEIKYKCITRFFDNNGNGEGAVGIYNQKSNKYETIGYGSANNGWSGDIIKDGLVDKSYLNDNPDKIWYSINPKNRWYPLGPLDEKYTDEWKAEFDAAFNKIPEKYRDMIESGDDAAGCFEYNYADYENYWACEWHFTDKKDCDSPDDEIMKFTGKDIIEIISACETFTEDFMKMQIHSCERVGADTEPILDDAWWINMLFYNDDGEVLYITSEDDRDEAGRRTGKLTLHKK